jgi:hypothetical protein
MNRTVINVATGEKTVVLLSPDEIAEIESRPPPAPPTSVTMRQARLALLQAGLLASVSAALAAATGMAGDAARIEWEYAATVDRDSPLVAGLVATLGLTDAQLDALFAAAAAL